ncbi:Myosin-like protein, partial [Globisporangium polare]
MLLQRKRYHGAQARQELEAARLDFNNLNELLDKTSTRSTTGTVDSNSSTGSTETETLNSSEPEDDDEEWVQSQSGGHHDNHDDGFDLDRPATDVAHFLEKRSTLSKPRFSSVANLQQRKEKSAQLLRLTDAAPVALAAAAAGGGAIRVPA